MPGTYPPGPPTLSGNLLTVHQLLNDPAYVSRILRTFRDLRFISDQMLTGRLRTEGGAVQFETGEGIITDRPVESVPPGAPYPRAHTPVPTTGLASVQKWGQATELTDEEVKRNRFPGLLVEKKLRALITAVISTVDALTMSAITSQVTATFVVTAGGGIAWNVANALFLRDILRAKAQILALNAGYFPDTLLLNDIAYAYLMSDEKFTNAIRRETTDSPVYTGEVDRVGGLTILVSSQVATGTAWVLDSRQLGSMADETELSPGYSIGEMAVETKTIRKDETDGWLSQGRRVTVPVVQEPNAAVKITATGL